MKVKIDSLTLIKIGQLLKESDSKEINNILNDVFADNKDNATAIRLALVKNGIKPEIDKTSRVKITLEKYLCAYAVYEFIHYSYILDKVTYKKTIHKYNIENNCWTDSPENNYTYCSSASVWENEVQTLDIFHCVNMDALVKEYKKLNAKQ